MADPAAQTDQPVPDLDPQPNTDAGGDDADEMFDFGSAYEDVKDAPCRVGCIYLQGLHRTKHSVLDPALAPLRDARTLDEVKDGMLKACDYLTDLGIFSAVGLQAMEGMPVSCLLGPLACVGAGEQCVPVLG